MSITKITKFINQFFEDNESEEDITALWNSDENQKAFKKILATFKIKKEKPKKDPKAPKRGKSNYLWFCAENREAVTKEMKEADPDVKSTEITSELGRRWQALKDSMKKKDVALMAKYNAMSADDKKRYEEEMSEYTPPADTETKSKGKKSKGKKDPDAPKGRSNAYIFFCSANREDVTAEMKENDPDTKSKDVMRELGVRWQALKASKKKADTKLMAKYKAMADKDKERYNSEKEEYESGKSADEEDDVEAVEDVEVVEDVEAVEDDVEVVEDVEEELEEE